MLAHPDDDVFVRPVLLAGVRAGRAPVVIYLTSGDAGGRQDPHMRRVESLRALACAGVATHDVHFVGIDAQIPDGRLVGFLDRALAHAIGAIAAYDERLRVISHAWEAGHPDHDAAHLVAMALARRTGAWGDAVVFPSYRGSVGGLAPFVVGSPLAVNGQVREWRVSFRDALSTLGSVRFYPSQWRTFMGLGPGLFWRFGVVRGIAMQPLCCSCAPNRPMGGRLLCETRFGQSWSEFADLARTFLERQGIGLPGP